MLIGHTPSSEDLAMKSTLWRWPILTVALVAVLSFGGQAEAQKRKQQFGGQPNNQFGGPPKGGQFGGQPKNQFGGGGAGASGNQAGGGGGAQFGNQAGGGAQFGNQMGGQFPDDDPFNGRPPIGGATNAQMEKATRSATGGMIAVGIVSLMIGVCIL